MAKDSNKKILIVIIVVMILFVLGYGILAYRIYWSEPSLDKSLVSENDFRGEASYIINYGGEDTKEYQLDISETSTVFSLLEELARGENFEIETTFYPEMGIFVKSIGGAEGGTDDKWWQYWVNDNLGGVAADKKEVKAGDIIEWRFEIIQF
jgi:hypothetical protein